MIENDPKLYKMTQIRKNYPKMTQNDLNLNRNTYIYQKGPELPTITKMTQNNPKMIQSESQWTRITQNAPKLS